VSATIGTAFRAAAACALGLLAAACITVDVGPRDKGQTPTDRFHVLESVEPPAAPRATSGRSLSVQSLRGRDRFAKHVLRREADGTVVALDHEFWADEPTSAVTDALREALAGSGVFSWVADPTDAVEADLVLSGQVLDFSLDGSQAGASAARVRLRLTLADPKSGNVLHTGAFEAAEPLPGGALPRLGPTMAKAVARCLRDAVQAWDAAGAMTSGR